MPGPFPWTILNTNYRVVFKTKQNLNINTCSIKTIKTFSCLPELSLTLDRLLWIFYLLNSITSLLHCICTVTTKTMNYYLLQCFKSRGCDDDILEKIREFNAGQGYYESLFVLIMSQLYGEAALFLSFPGTRLILFYKRIVLELGILNFYIKLQLLAHDAFEYYI